MNYPDTYPPKLDCISIIVAKAGQVIHHSFPQKDDQLRLSVSKNPQNMIVILLSQVVRLLFDHIDVEHHSDCNYDFIEIRDGDLPTSKVLGKFCGDLPPR